MAALDRAMGRVSAVLLGTLRIVAAFLLAQLATREAVGRPGGALS